jgi:hypothetical protein
MRLIFVGMTQDSGARMKPLTVTAAAMLLITALGCDSSNTAPATQASPYAAYQPTSGQNLSPGIAPYAHGDPEWPMDAGQNVGGGGRR